MGQIYGMTCEAEGCTCEIIHRVERDEEPPSAWASKAHWEQVSIGGLRSYWLCPKHTAIVRRLLGLDPPEPMPPIANIAGRRPRKKTA